MSIRKPMRKKYPLIPMRATTTSLLHIDLMAFSRRHYPKRPTTFHTHGLASVHAYIHIATYNDATITLNCVHCDQLPSTSSLYLPRGGDIGLHFKK